jgi:hypothetical protein
VLQPPLESTGGLPLGLEQAAAYISATGTVTLARYAELFATRALELLKRGQPLGYQHTVATTWSLALQKLQETEPVAVGLLTLAAFMAPDDIPQALLAGDPGQLPEPLAVAADPVALGDTVAALRRYSLVQVIGDSIIVHRLVQAVSAPRWMRRPSGLGRRPQYGWSEPDFRPQAIPSPIGRDASVSYRMRWPSPTTVSDSPPSLKRGCCC